MDKERIKRLDIDNLHHIIVTYYLYHPDDRDDLENMLREILETIEHDQAEPEADL